MNLDNKLFNGLSRIGDMLLLNILYLVCCIPVVTIGAATTALYYTTMKMAENKESYVVKDFIKSFKENFKQATILWLIVGLCGAALILDAVMAGGITGALGSVMSVIVIVLGIFLILMGVYTFPLLARFDNTVGRTLKNAVIIAIRHLPSTVLILLIHAVPLSLAFVSVAVFIRGFVVVMLFLASLLAYLESKLFVRIFKNYYPRTECCEVVG